MEGSRIALITICIALLVGIIRGQIDFISFLIFLGIAVLCLG